VESFESGNQVLDAVQRLSIVVALLLDKEREIMIELLVVVSP
jgi:hypothetical protein